MPEEKKDEQTPAQPPAAPIEDQDDGSWNVDEGAKPPPFAQEHLRTTRPDDKIIRSLNEPM